jgi:short-chain Z-isoprenyl diphosphate synthase
MSLNSMRINSEAGHSKTAETRLEYAPRGRERQQDSSTSMTEDQEARSHVLAALYRIYERRLSRQVGAQAVPRHVGVILDGNRRYGRQHQFTDPEKVYTLGADKLDDLLAWCVELKIPAVTLWVLSTDNLARKPQEVSGILRAIETKLLKLAKAPQIHRQRVRVRAIGCLDLLPPATIAAVRAAESATEGYDGLQLTIAAAYGGRQEITDAVQSFLREQLAKGRTLADVVDMVTPDAVGRHIYSPDLPDPDLIIRTSGEIRLSGFLLWQSTTSEFYFSEVNWPAFRKIDFLRAIRAFQNRSRRYGL